MTKIHSQERSIRLEIEISGDARCNGLEAVGRICSRGILIASALNVKLPALQRAHSKEP